MRYRVKYDFLVIVAFSIAFFGFIFGFQILNPTYINWLLASGGDTFGQFIAWQFYRNEPLTFPLGIIHSYLYPLGTSAVFGDIIPLIAIPAQYFFRDIATSFQYVGIWLLSCYILQGIVAWMLCGYITRQSIPRILATLFFILSPIMLYRVGQNSLVAHWLVLASLYLYFQKGTSRVFILWSGLIILTTLVHLYFTPMVLVIWLAFMLKSFLADKTSSLLMKFLVINIVLGGLLLCIMWCVGYFVIPLKNGIAPGWGALSLNLISVFFPIYTSVAKDTVVSPFLTTHIIPQYQYEGFNYLGAGILFIAVISTYELLKSRPSSRLIKSTVPLAIAMIILTLWAASSRIYFGNHLLLNLPTPAFLGLLVNTFRASGRLFWPVYYLLMFVIIAIVVRRNTVLKSSLILSLALLIQFVDIHSLIVKQQTFFKRPQIWNGGKIQSQFWQKLTNISTVIVLPPVYDSDLEYYIATHHMRTNAGYVSRYNAGSTQANDAFLSDFKTGNLLSNTMYVINDKAILVSALPHLKSTVCYGAVDGYTIVLLDCATDIKSWLKK